MTYQPPVYDISAEQQRFYTAAEGLQGTIDYLDKVTKDAQGLGAELRAAMDTLGEIEREQMERVERERPVRERLAELEQQERFERLEQLKRERASSVDVDAIRKEAYERGFKDGRDLPRTQWSRPIQK